MKNEKKHISNDLIYSDDNIIFAIEGDNRHTWKKTYIQYNIHPN